MVDKVTTKSPLGTGTVLATPTGANTGSVYKGTVAGASTLKPHRVPSASASYAAPDFGTTQAITNAVYQNLMGRNATDAEISQYHQQYTQYAQSHPTSTSSSMAVVDSSTGAVLKNQSTSTSSGLSEQDFISNLISGKAEAKQYTAATTYMDAINNEIAKAQRGAY